jgi:hypothetical protein
VWEDSKLSTVIFNKCLTKQKHPWLTPRVRTPMSHLRTTPRLPDCCHATGCLFFPYCTLPALHSTIQICNHHFHYTPPTSQHYRRRLVSNPGRRLGSPVRYRVSHQMPRRICFFFVTCSQYSCPLYVALSSILSCY